MHWANRASPAEHGGERRRPKIIEPRQELDLGGYRSRFSAFCLFIGYVDLAKRKKRSMTSPTIPTVQSFADFSRVMLAGQVSDDAGISVDFPLLRR